MENMAELLSETDITEALNKLPYWQRAGDALERTAELADFPQAIAVVNRVADLAEGANHHPDMDIRWRTVTFRCRTHSAGGITGKDVSLAEQIDNTIDAL